MKNKRSVKDYGIACANQAYIWAAPTGQEQTDTEAGEPNEVDELYTGMRVEVTTFDGRMLFIAKLMCIRQDTAQLHEYIESTDPQPQQVEEALHVRIRGYSDYEKKAVYLEGYISPLPQAYLEG